METTQTIRRRNRPSSGVRQYCIWLMPKHHAAVKEYQRQAQLGTFSEALRVIIEKALEMTQ